MCCYALSQSSSSFAVEYFCKVVSVIQPWSSHYDFSNVFCNCNMELETSHEHPVNEARAVLLILREHCCTDLGQQRKRQ